jgi:broad specificity phosphatase PhoE
VDTRLREQEWGNFQRYSERQEKETDRRNLGSFYYRFNNGESGADLAERVRKF